MASLLLKIEVNTMMSSLQFSSVAIKTTNQYLEKIGEFVRPDTIFETCDQAEITHRGYEAMFKKFKTSATSSAKRIRVSCLPKPLYQESTQINEQEGQRHR